MTASTRKSCKHLRLRNFIRIKYVIPPATVVNPKSGDISQGVDANRFTCPVSVTSIRLMSSHSLEAMGLGAGPCECACGVLRDNVRKFFGFDRLLKNSQAGPLPASANSCSPPGSRRKILRPSTLMSPWVESFANIRERVSGIVPIRLANWPLDMFKST